MPLAFTKGTDSLSDTVSKDRRLLYTDDISQSARTNEPMNRSSKLPQRTSSTFITMAALFLAAVVIILYISNIITVNRLAVEVGELQQKYEALRNGNEILRAEINRRSSLERIGKIATDQLGLRYPKEQPQLLEIDEKLVRDRQGVWKER